MIKPGIKHTPTVDDIVVFPKSREFNTKSNGILRVPFAIPLPELSLFDYTDLKLPDKDIRGLRVYMISGLNKDSVGGDEYHKVRTEIVVVLSGQVLFVFRDLFGEVRNCVLRAGSAVMIPHHILHTYKVEKDNSSLMVIANTLFNPDDPTTHDTFSIEQFDAESRRTLGIEILGTS